jgi:hypothetical protein
MEQEEHHQHGELRTLKLELRREGGVNLHQLSCLEKTAFNLYLGLF